MEQSKRWQLVWSRLALWRTADPLRREVLHLAMPAVGEQVLSLMVGIVNTMLVGYLGAAALAAVGLSSTLQGLATVFFSSIATGSTALVAHATGAQDRPLASCTLQHAMILALTLGLVALVVVLPFRRAALALMGAEPESLRMGVSYLTCITLALPFLSLMMVGNGAMRGSGNTRTPMLIMAGVNVVNLTLSLVLIRGLGPIPSLGVTGAGIAAATSTLLGSLTVVALLLSGRITTIRLERRLKRFDLGLVRRLLAISLPAGGESLLMNLAFMTYVRAISSLGTAAYAAYLITQRVESLNTMPAFGFAIASTALAGQALGAGDPDRARRSVFKAVQVSLLLAAVCALTSLLFPQFMLGLFTDDPQVIAQGTMPLRIVGLVQPIMSVTFCLAGGLRGAGDTRTVMVVTGIGAWLVRVPVALFVLKKLGLGLPGLQASMMLDWLTRMLLYAWRFRPQAWARRAARLLAGQFSSARSNL